ncbi:hypothetical protein ACMX8W_14245 [Bacillus subtilis]|uniref:hypothetical protein n=1 Tax=Bacillus subtilis TaxID=1423 RepID=UPI00157DBDE2|nr:hypothetical protein [Bacillus subtilis]MBE1867330.1 hypothetical protein [Bacillus subtilis]MEA1024758.1 hypothetical protein [Bacillus subtilis]NUC10807.1 hypothetical protein [Bacillus subtilis]
MNYFSREMIMLYGVGATLFIGILNLISSRRSNKKTIYVNAVTSERVKWMTNLKELISEYLSLTTYYDDKPFLTGEDQANYFERLFYLQGNIKLQLNYADEKDQEINILIEKINQKIIGLYSAKKIISNKDFPSEDLHKAMNFVLENKGEEFGNKIKKEKDYSIDKFLTEITNEAITVFNESFRDQYGYKGRDELRQLTDDLVNKCREYLKLEWEKVKKEAENGKIK